MPGYKRPPVRRHVTRPEQNLQIGVVKALAKVEALSGGEEFFFFHPANGGYRQKAEAAILKAMGVRAGVSDMFFLFPAEYCDLDRGDGEMFTHELKPGTLAIIEYKAGKGDTTDNQEGFGRKMAMFGIPWYVVAAENVEDATVQTFRILHRHVSPDSKTRKILESYIFSNGVRI